MTDVLEGSAGRDCRNGCGNKCGGEIVIYRNRLIMSIVVGACKTMRLVANDRVLY